MAVGVGLGVSVPAGVDGVGATGDVDCEPEGASPEEDAPLEAGPLEGGADGPTEVSFGGGTMMVVSPGGGGYTDEVDAVGVGVGPPGLPGSQSVTVTVTVTGGTGMQAMRASVLPVACRGPVLTSNLGQIEGDDSSDKRSSDSEDLEAEHGD